MTTTREVTEDEINYIVFQVKSAYKVDFSEYAPSSFKRRIERILMMFRIPTAAALVTKIKEDKVFFQTFLEEVTVNTTEMFRDPEVWKSIKEKILPTLAKNQSINIWHAGCSTGEEVTTMAILLKEAGLLGKAKAFASDINPRVIENAKNGKVFKRSLPLHNKNYREAGGKEADLSSYYTEVSHDQVAFNPELLKHVKFQKFDLVKDICYLKFDLILCRNVMIYFNKALQDNTGKLFRNSLFSKGFLVLGNKESLVWCSVANEFKIASNEHKIYQLKA